MSRLKSWTKQTEGYRETRQRVRPQHQRDRDEDNNEASFDIDKNVCKKFLTLSTLRYPSCAWERLFPDLIEDSFY